MITLLLENNKMDFIIFNNQIFLKIFQQHWCLKGYGLL